MKKQVTLVDKKAGIFQVTTQDERFYAFPSIDPKTKLPVYNYKDSITWVCSFLGKDSHLMKWIAAKGYDESQAEMKLAGARGSKIHSAIDQLLKTKEVVMEDKFYHSENDQLEELTPDEYQSVLAFAEWYKSVNPTIVMNEGVVFSEEDNIAGTVDLVAEINGEPWIIDFKTGKAVYMEYEMQLSAYKKCLNEMHKNKFKNARMAVLLLNASVNKNGYRFTETAERYDLFLATKKIKDAKSKDKGPAQVTLPVKITLE